MKLFLLCILFLNFCFDPCIAEALPQTDTLIVSTLQFIEVPSIDPCCNSETSPPPFHASPSDSSCLHCHFAHTFSMPFANNNLNNELANIQQPIPYDFSLGAPHPKKLLRPPIV